MQDSASVIEQLDQVFSERGAPIELLADNATSFRSQAFGDFAERWGIAMRFRSAHQPSGNGVVERCHRTVKRTVARTGCSVRDAVYLHNVTPKDDKSAGTAPANAIYVYEVRVRGIDKVVRDPGVVTCRFSVGDRVSVRDPSRRCDVPSVLKTVTGIVSPQTVEVDGMPRHVRDLRASVGHVRATAVREAEPGVEADVDDDDDESLVIHVPLAGDGGSGDDVSVDDDGDNEEEVLPRRGERIRRPAQLVQYADL